MYQYLFLHSGMVWIPVCLSVCLSSNPMLFQIRPTSTKMRSRSTSWASSTPTPTPTVDSFTTAAAAWCSERCRSWCVRRTTSWERRTGVSWTAAMTSFARSASEALRKASQECSPKASSSRTSRSRRMLVVTLSPHPDTWYFETNQLELTSPRASWLARGSSTAVPWVHQHSGRVVFWKLTILTNYYDFFSKFWPPKWWSF